MKTAHVALQIAQVPHMRAEDACGSVVPTARLFSARPLVRAGLEHTRTWDVHAHTCAVQSLPQATCALKAQPHLPLATLHDAKAERDVDTKVGARDGDAVYDVAEKAKDVVAEQREEARANPHRQPVRNGMP